MNLSLRASLVSAALLGLVGCGPQIYAEPLNAPIRPMVAKDPSEVPLLTQRPDRPFVEVSTLEIVAAQTDLTSGTLFSKLRVSGAWRGCDAVILVGRSDREPLFERGIREGYLASCIQFVDGPPPVVRQATTGSLCFAPGTARPRVEVDGRGYQVSAGCVVLTCGRHRVHGGAAATEVDVPCGQKTTL